MPGPTVDAFLGKILQTLCSTGISFKTLGSPPSHDEVQKDFNGVVMPILNRFNGTMI